MRLLAQKAQKQMEAQKCRSKCRSGPPRSQTPELAFATVVAIALAIVPVVMSGGNPSGMKDVSPQKTEDANSPAGGQKG